ncbi:MAG: hypothetical protein ASARMPRED_008432 [Alectoria sarmentosa]|nr:MAG: hypothetical protein ASARMPRED_008432 [Alectoria sarmentosa]
MLRAASTPDDNHNAEITATGAAFITISSAGIIARMVSKSMKRNPLQVDDLLLIWAYIVAVGETGMIIWGDSVGLVEWQIVEANITVFCVALVASRPVATFLIPDGLVARLGSYFSRSLLSREARRTANEQAAADKDPFGSNSHLESVQYLELQDRAGSAQAGNAKSSPNIKSEVFPSETPPVEAHTHRERFDYVG